MAFPNNISAVIINFKNNGKTENNAVVAAREKTFSGGAQINLKTAFDVRSAGEDVEMDISFS